MSNSVYADDRRLLVIRWDGKSSVYFRRPRNLQPGFRVSSEFGEGGGGFGELGGWGVLLEMSAAFLKDINLGEV